MLTLTALKKYRKKATAKITILIGHYSVGYLPGKRLSQHSFRFALTIFCLLFIGRRSAFGGKKNSKTHAQIYKADRQKFYCAVELPLSEYAHTATGYPQELDGSSPNLNSLYPQSDIQRNLSLFLAMAFFQKVFQTNIKIVWCIHIDTMPSPFKYYLVAILTRSPFVYNFDFHRNIVFTAADQ